MNSGLTALSVLVNRHAPFADSLARTSQEPSASIGLREADSGTARSEFQADGSERILAISATAIVGHPRLLAPCS